MLTEQQQTIKRYIKQFHDKGIKPKVSEIATAFSITITKAKTEIKAIRLDHNNTLSPFNFDDSPFGDLLKGKF